MTPDVLQDWTMASSRLSAVFLARFSAKRRSGTLPGQKTKACPNL
jgi:hypothetical protein